eukprot:scaffold504061_cov32-Prasinocladus_malaysianus.AAC.1
MAGINSAKLAVGQHITFMATKVRGIAELIALTPKVSKKRVSPRCCKTLSWLRMLGTWEQTNRGTRLSL